MFSKLFSESGLSLDRLKALLEVGAAGSIVKAADGEPVRQSQYSRQIKELEEFFRIKLIERQGKGTRLTLNGRELARISRFFMLGLSNFQRGCLAEEKKFTIGASATFIRHFLVPELSVAQPGPLYATAVANQEEIERGLHDLTLDFGIVARAEISRPLQTRLLGDWRLELWVPRALHTDEAKAARAFKDKRLPLVFAQKELDGLGVPSLKSYEAKLTCDSFLEARAAIEGQRLAAILPGFLAQGKADKSFVRARIPLIGSRTQQFRLAWNPRLIRLTPPAGKRRDWLAIALARRMATLNSS